MMITSLKTIHWSALGLAVLAFVFAWAANQPQLAQFQSLLNALATFLGAGGMGTALAAPKVGT
jgi:hypothetical protein